MRRKERSITVLVTVGLLVVLLYALAAKTGVIAVVSSKDSSQVKYKNYRYQDVSLTVSLPETTEVTEDYYSSGEMVLNSQLCDEVHKYHGYIQIWRVDDPEEFIKRSKLNSTFRFTSFEHKKIKLDSYQGFIVSWSAELQDSGHIAGRDYLLQKKGGDGEFLRISLTAREKVFPEKLGKIADTMVSSVVWK